MVRQRAADAKQTLVILDSDHSKDHVLAEMNSYHPLVRPGGYMIVEDTIVNGHPLRPEFGPGPMEAVEEFLQSSDSWIIDRSKEKFLLSFNRSGYLKRVR
jgi:cephalosporin hydroxylase